jgi:hypothetical protein
MKLEEELETAVTAAGRHARPGEQPVAVVAAEPAGTRVFVVALAAGEDLGFVAVDRAGTAVADRRLVKDAVSLAALAERAEEVSGATAADDLVEQFRGTAESLRAAGEGEAAAAAEAVAEAGVRLGAAAAGPRAATPVYLDRLAALAGELAAAIDAFVAQAERLGQGAEQAAPAAQAAWTALAVAGRAGEPGNFARAMTAASGAVDALVADVLDNYRVELEA